MFEKEAEIEEHIHGALEKNQYLENNQSQGAAKIHLKKLFSSEDVIKEVFKRKVEKR